MLYQGPDGIKVAGQLGAGQAANVTVAETQRLKSASARRWTSFWTESANRDALTRSHMNERR